jgi:ribonuclease HII
LKVSHDKPSLRFEEKFHRKGYRIIAGIDEAGRGPIAGPVVAASVILDQNNIPKGINDSKKLSPASREIIFHQIMLTAIVGIGIADIEKIDSVNILNATKYAMNLSSERLDTKPDLLLIDGNFTINNNIKNISIIKGDTKSLSIAAASIIAKVTRDSLMNKFAHIYTKYAFTKNKGYPTKDHLNIVHNFGICPLHRKSFNPINKIIKKNNL